MTKEELLGLHKSLLFAILLILNTIITIKIEVRMMKETYLAATSSGNHQLKKEMMKLCNLLDFS